VAVAGPHQGGEAPLDALAAGQAAGLWPGLAADVAWHDAACLHAAVRGVVRVRVAG
jgi:hypothetical protein